ncbi:MAG TPA: hypothetical protein DDY16_06070 [Tenacibaculum sp.]|nr:hypothetical protein [Tenacibaculum sp.]HBI40496.1 hypothetical protein [Tenacibaculum sp.]|tara:strand:- start:518 stop:940 length:423 start_codon:yes stop_codon:yes gene_type:complete
MKSSKSKSDEPYDEFYASLKLASGEEILALVMVDNSDVPENVVVSNPVVCQEIRSSGTNIPMGYKFEPWMKLTDDDTFVISLKKVITISQINSTELIDTYKDLVEHGFKATNPDLTKDMGYISSVSKARDILEKLYKSKN